MSDWRENKAWSDRFLPEIKRTLGECLFEVSDPYTDQKLATDLMLSCAGRANIACRVRKYDYWLKYPDQFTIRASYGNGAETELNKIMAGLGDYLFYGFANRQERRLAAWLLGDLDVFRHWMQQTWKRYGLVLGQQRFNADGVGFWAFNVADLPPTFCVRRFVSEEATCCRDLEISRNQTPSTNAC